MKAKDAKQGVQLADVLREIPHISRALTDRVKGKYYDAVHLELQAAQMVDGHGDGADFYCDVPPAVGRKILAAAEKIIRAELKKLGVEP